MTAPAALLDRQRRASAATLDAIRWIVRDVRQSSVASEREFGVSAAQLFVLHTLAEKGPMSLGELAEHALTHQSSASVVARKLTEQGLISRTRAAQDGRRLELAVTKLGRNVLMRAPQTPQERLIGALDQMRIENREQLAILLGELILRLAPTGHAPPMLFEDGPADNAVDSDGPTLDGIRTAELHTG